MAARVKEAVQRSMADFPEPVVSRTAGSGAARDVLFASLSRELRWSLDGEGRVLFLEGAWPSVLGWQHEHLQGWHCDEIVHPDDRPQLAAALARLRSDGGWERDIELRLAVRTGGHQRTSWTLAAGSGQDSVLGVGHDRTGPAAPYAGAMETAAALERRNQELGAWLAELEDRYFAVERFSATAAHQLAEPLVIAESSAIMVAEQLGADLDPMLRGRLDAIGRAAGRARRLMDALLADARTNDRPPELHPVDLGAVVEDVITGLEHQIEERGATVVVGPLPNVHGEPGLLSVVIENLLSNALKYGPRRDGTVDIAAEWEPAGWRISVASEGMPIPAEEAERIFRPFHRVSSERRVPGVGLGLTICIRLVERLGGTIGVEPGGERGNTFWVRLLAAE
jgi:signal transduction histidine kinase